MQKVRGHRDTAFFQLAQSLVHFFNVIVYYKTLQQPSLPN